MMRKLIRLTESRLISVIKRIIKESNELTEIGGISMESRNWSEVLFSKIKESDKKDFSIKGKDFPDLYERFKVDRFDIKFLPIGAFAYDQNSSGFIGDEYVVTLVVDPNLFNNLDITVLNHEMKHAYQDFKRYENKSTPLKDSKFINDLYTSDFEEVVTGFMRGRNHNDVLIKILFIYYALSKVEQDAYLENIYDDSQKGIKYGFSFTPIRAMNELKFLDFTRLNKWTWEDLTKLDIPFIKKFKTMEEFATYSEKYLKRQAEIFRKKINKMKYLNLNQPEQEKETSVNEPKIPIEKQNKVEPSKDEGSFVGGLSGEELKNQIEKQLKLMGNK